MQPKMYVKIFLEKTFFPPCYVELTILKYMSFFSDLDTLDLLAKFNFETLPIRR